MIKSALKKKNFEVIKFSTLIVERNEERNINVSDSHGFFSVLARSLDWLICVIDIFSNIHKFFNDKQLKFLYQ